jgi:hypothetical protein
MKNNLSTLKEILKNVQPERHSNRTHSRVLNVYDKDYCPEWATHAEKPPEVEVLDARKITDGECRRCHRTIRSLFEIDNGVCNVCLSTDWECSKCHGLLTMTAEVKDELCWSCKRGEVKDLTCAVCHKIQSEGTFRVYEGTQRWVCDLCFVGPSYQEGKYFLDSRKLIEVELDDQDSKLIMFPLAEKPKFHKDTKGRVRKIVRIVPKGKHIFDFEYLDSGVVLFPSGRPGCWSRRNQL